MSKSTNKPTTSFWIISVIALIWNLIGVIQYLMQAYMTDEVVTTLPEPVQLYYENLPSWVTAAFALAVFTGLLGCIALLIRKKIAYYLFIISFICVVAQSIYNLVIQDFMPVETSQLIVTMFIFVIAAFLIWFTSKSIKANMIS